MIYKLWPGNNIIVTNYNKNTEIVYEVLVGGVNGDVIETVMDKTSYDVAKYTYYNMMKKVSPYVCHCLMMILKTSTNVLI